MFAGRPPGTTLRRTREAITHPHPATERFDPDFPTALACDDCGKYTYAPRRHMAEAMAEHRRSYCNARTTKVDEPHLCTILYPRT